MMNEPCLTSHDSPWWAKLLEIILRNYGAPTLMLIVLSYGIWIVGCFVKDEIVKPFWSAHLSQMETLENNLEAQTETLKIQTDILREVKDTSARSVQVAEEMTDLLKENQELIKARNGDGS